MKYYIGQQLKTRQNVLTVTGVSSKYIYTEYINDFGTHKSSQKVEVLDDMINSGKIEMLPYIQSIICNDIVEEIPAQKENDTMNDTIQRLLSLRSKCTTDELTSLNRIILEVDGQLNMSMAAYSYHANNIAHLLCADDKFSLVPSHVEHHSALCDDTGDFDDIGMETYADCYHSAQKAKYGLL